MQTAPLGHEYRVLVFRNPETGNFVAHAPELDGCEIEAPTRAQALAALEEEISARLANMKAQSIQPPTPVEDPTSFTGELSLRVPSILHRDLVWQARLEKTPVEQLVTELLARALEFRRIAGRPERQAPEAARRDRPRDRASGSQYHGIMDDRANFIEYVRGLEPGARARGRR